MNRYSQGRPKKEGEARSSLFDRHGLMGVQTSLCLRPQR
jgi:hypothetical protein